MHTPRFRFQFFTLILGVIGFITEPHTFAAGISWTNATSSFWRIGTNWDAGEPPSVSFDPTALTNAGTKTVTVDAATPTVNLTIQGLSVSAPSGSTNTLLLADLPSAFVTEGPVHIEDGGALRITNSTFTALDTFDIRAGNLTMDSGLLDTTPSFVTVRLGRIVGATATATLSGGTVKCFGFKIGDLSGSQGACTLDGGTLQSSSVVSMGEILNSPGTLTILAGQLIATNDLTKVGNLASGELNQSGGSSLLSFLSIADNAPGTVTVSNGQLTVSPNTPNDVTRVGNFGAGQLNISGGVVWLRGEFHIADNPGIHGDVVLSGGKLVSTNDITSIGRYGIGTMIVTNATAWLTNCSVGRHPGATGTLTIQNGGSVFVLNDLSIGRFTNSLGHVGVSGGLLSLTNEPIWVGRDGIGELTVSDGTVIAERLYVGMSEDGTNAPQGSVTMTGGRILLTSNLVVGTSLLSTGQVSLLGGVLTVTNGSANGSLDVANGTVSLSQGFVAADAVVLTNSSGHLDFTGGTLQAGSMNVANGVPFVVGDGVNPATLQLEGGVFSFANGLVIASNAVVTGCGTILGSIVNNGTLNTNCPASVTITDIARSGTTTKILFSTISGANHLLEYKTSLSGSNWTAIEPGIIGTGGVVTNYDSAATNATRFYRIHVP